VSLLHLQSLRAYGCASVLVFLEEGVAPREARRLLSRFVRAPNSQAAALAEAAGAGRAVAPAGRYYPNLGVLLGTVDRDAYRRLRADRRVRKIASAPRLEHIRPVSSRPAKLAEDRTWGIRALRIDLLWQEGLSGAGVTVGHLDTGVDGAHAALRGAIAGFAEFDEMGRQVRPAPEPSDSGEHGTHTAATIVGRPVRGRAVGVAPRARLYSAMVIEGGDAVARVLGGMDWALGRGVRVLNMSLGFPGWWDDFLELTRIIRGHGALPVFAVGNEGPGTSRSPGNYAEALSVGAADRSSRVAWFSSSDRFDRARDPIVPDVVAPGVDVISARPGAGYQSMSGTSMAAPHVAGLAALLFEATPDASVDDVETAIFASATPLPGDPATRQGRGLPDGRAALERLRGKVAPGPARAASLIRSRR
jgi:subtilisin family serine protease